MERGLDYELQIEIAKLDNISFNGWNPLNGDEIWASPYYEDRVKEEQDNH
jgi:hypothetical protein